MSTPSRPRLNRDLHIRIDERLQDLITRVSAENHLKDSTLCRAILLRELPNYARNRFFA